MITSAARMHAVMGTCNSSPAPHDKYRCPITMDIMRDPVVASDGHTYERAAIRKWFNQQQRSPMTGLPCDKRLIENRSLRVVITDWQVAANAA